MKRKNKKEERVCCHGNPRLQLTLRNFFESGKVTVVANDDTCSLTSGLVVLFCGRNYSACLLRVIKASSPSPSSVGPGLWARWNANTSFDTTTVGAWSDLSTCLEPTTERESCIRFLYFLQPFPRAFDLQPQILSAAPKPLDVAQLLTNSS